jgi:NAD+ synthase (glutamine-hydrolysing)
MKLKMCQLNYIVGDLEGNTNKIIYEINNCFGEEIIVFSELAITGYPPLDLLDNKNFIKDQLFHKDRIIAASKNFNGIVIFGYIEKNNGNGKGLFNSVMVCGNGKEIYNYRKRLLPTYDIFDEARYFEPGEELGLFQYKGQRIGIAICEDLWKNKLYNIDTARELFEAKVDFVISVNASPSVVRKYKQKVEMFKNISFKYALPIIYVNQVGGNDDIVFDGASFVTNKNGKLVKTLNKFKEDVSLIDLDIIEPHSPLIQYNGLELNDFESDAQFFYEQAVLGIRDYIRKCGFKGVVIGESGGIDSAVVTALAVDAIGSDNVVAITMPSQFSSEGSYKDSEILCQNLGVKLYTYPIGENFDLLKSKFNEVFGDAEHGTTEENLQARIRGQILMAFSNRYGYLVLSTGNKSELSVGFSTIYGDLCGGLMPISDLYKMEVFALARYFNKFHCELNFIPLSIIEKEPSAELSPNQKDSDSLPEYPILDTMLKYIIEGKELEDGEIEECEKIIANNINDYKRVCKMIRNAEFKRRQAAIGIKMHKKAFGYGRRIPVVQKWANY